MKENDPIYTQKELNKLFSEFNADFAEKIIKQKARSSQIEVIREINDLLDLTKAPKRPTRLERIGKIADYFYYGGVISTYFGMFMIANHDLENIGLAVTFTGLATGLGSLVTRLICDDRRIF